LVNAELIGKGMVHR